jgi:diphosphomevalonate decarboxylase
VTLEAVAVSHPNIALSKYWGKREGEGNFPAVPSLSVTLQGLSTRTRVTWRRDAAGHRLVLDGRVATVAESTRAQALLEALRRELSLDETADVESTNDFPTASGLASSASGFSALALAAVRAAGADWDATRVSDLARRASASAARSVFGGFVELPVGATSASQVAPASHLPLVVLVCVTSHEAKSVGSTDGMRVTLEKSPYARAWLEHAPRLHAELREALLARDFDRVGALAEASALAMHASAIAAGVVYWNAATVEALGAVRRLRAEGLGVHATIDAGPHVKVLVRPGQAAAAHEALARVPGVLRVVEARPGEGARLEAGA